MSLLQALVLGVVQGLTEFLPVSSTAHLILVSWALGWEFPEEDQFVFDVLVQWGTLAAVLAYFRTDLLGILRASLRGLRERRPLGTPEARLGWWVLLGTLPAVAVGLSFREFFQDLHGRPAVVAGILAGATGFLYLGERCGRRVRGMESLGAKDALALGLWQALALFPGVSRSGATISGGLLAGLDRTAAARFSFLLSVPVMLGAGTLAAAAFAGTPGASDRAAPLAVGFLAAAAVGFASIHWLLRFLARSPLTAFGPYRLLAGAALLALALLRARG